MDGSIVGHIVRYFTIERIIFFLPHGVAAVPTARVRVGDITRTLITKALFGHGVIAPLTVRVAPQYPPNG